MEFLTFRVSRLTKHVLFDFDGTLSLIRAGWQQIMRAQFLEHLLPLRRLGSSPCQLEALVDRTIAETTGKQTIWQMMWLADEVKRRGGYAREPGDYKAEYLARLNQHIAGRLTDLRDGGLSQAEKVNRYAVPGAWTFLPTLAHLHEPPLIYFASGTDEPNVCEEASLLGFAEFATGGIYGAQGNSTACSKAEVIGRLLVESGALGEELVVIGDGPVEIREGRKVGAFCLGIATNEAQRGGWDEAKAERLRAAGADVVLRDFAEMDTLGLIAGA